MGDLVGDGSQVALQLGDAFHDFVAVSLEQRAPLRERRVAVAAQLGEALHVTDRHAGRA